MEQINYIAVIVTAFIIQFVGFLWYSPILFGSKWMKLLKTNSEEVKAMGKTPHLLALITAFFHVFYDGIHSIMDRYKQFIFGNRFGYYNLVWSNFT